jgi:hypothetical protein
MLGFLIPIAAAGKKMQVFCRTVEVADMGGEGEQFGLWTMANCGLSSIVQPPG